jgi:hypothetical protein
VKPQSHFAVAESVWLALAEAQLIFGDGLVAAAALGAAARGGFDHVRHAAIIGAGRGGRALCSPARRLLRFRTQRMHGEISLEHFFCGHLAAGDRYRLYRSGCD